MAKGRNFMPAKAVQRRQQPSRKKRSTKSVPKALLSANDRAYARLLADPCNAPFAPGMLANGVGTHVQRFEYDFNIALGATSTSVSVCVNPARLSIHHGFSDSDSTNITFTSAYPFPGSGVINAQATKYRCLAACTTVMWSGKETDRQGFVALGNATGGQVLAAQCTPAEIRSSMGYVARFPDQAVGIKYRPNEADLDMVTTQDNTLNSTAMWVQASGLAGNTLVRIKVVAVMEWEASLNFGLGTPIPQYAPIEQTDSSDRFIRAMNWLDKTGHWLLENGAAIGHAAYNVAGYLTM